MPVATVAIYLNAAATALRPPSLVLAHTKGSPPGLAGPVADATAHDRSWVRCPSQPSPSTQCRVDGPSRPANHCSRPSLKDGWPSQAGRSTSRMRSQGL